MKESAYLLPMTGNPKRYPFAVVDIETKKDETQEAGFTRPFLAGYYDGKVFVSFKGPQCLQQMTDFLLDPARDGWHYYAHNGGSFDWLHFLQYIIKTGYHFEILTVSSSIQMLRVARSANAHDKGWLFVDSYKLIPISLEKATKAFGVANPKQKFDFNTDENDSRWDEYNRIDCIGLFQTLERFYDLVETQLGGEVGITTASTAMRTFRRRYQKIPILRHQRHHEFFREAYYGGRVERVVTEADNLHYYDFNSAYPFVMQAPMPIGKLYATEGTPFAAITGNGSRIGFANVDIDYPTDVNFPVLPLRHNGKLCFPVGTFSGVWTSAEILAAQEQGARVTWHKSVWIDSGPVFGEMVQTLYRYRDKSLAGYDEGLAQTCKILMNALYGKFGMNTEREKIVYLADGEDPPEGSRPCQPRDPDCRLYLYTETVDAPYIAPQIAAYITSLSRLHLHKAIIRASEKGEVAYYDTDSILTTADMSSECNPKLGGLKDEGLGLTYRGVFLQPKLYSLEAQECNAIMLPATSLAALSGSSLLEASTWIENQAIPQERQGFLKKMVMKGYKERTSEGFEKIRMGEIISYESLEKIGALARVGFNRGPQMRMVTRQLRNQDSKRVFEGRTSRPLVLVNGQAIDKEE